MPEPGEPTGVAVQEVADETQKFEAKKPNERLLLLGQLTELVVIDHQRLLKKALDDNTERLSLSSRDRLSQQIKELDALLEMAAKIKNGEPLTPFENKNLPVDDPWTTSFRLVKEGGKLRSADRGGLTILNLQFVRAREGQSSVDQAYSMGLSGRDPQGMMDTHFHPQAQQTIFVNTLFAYNDSSTGKPRYKPQAGFALSYNQGENTQGVPTARVGAVTYQGFTPYISETSRRVLKPNFEQVKNTIVSGAGTPKGSVQINNSINHPYN